MNIRNAFPAIAAVLAFGLMVVAEPASAKTAGEVAENLTTSTKAIAEAVGAISTAAGFIMAFIGALKFKAHKDNPQQTPLSTPIIYLVVASLCLFLPSVIWTGSDTLFGVGGGQSQGMDGKKIGTGF